MAEPDAGAKPGWNDRLYERRNQLLAEPRFQRWASTFPPFKPVAAKRASDLFDLCAGFVYSQVLFACVELKLFEALAAGPVPLDALATRFGVTPERLASLLDAATALDLTQQRDAGYGLGKHGAAYLGNPGIGAMIAHHAMLYRDLADPVALLKSAKGDGELARFWPYAGADAPQDLGDEAVAPYGELMSSSLAMLSDDVLDAYPFVDHAELLDIGGGNGDFLVAAAHRRPDLRVTLFDLPAVAKQAEARFADERLAGALPRDRRRLQARRAARRRRPGLAGANRPRPRRCRPRFAARQGLGDPAAGRHPAARRADGRDRRRRAGRCLFRDVSHGDGQRPAAHGRGSLAAPLRRRLRPRAPGGDAAPDADGPGRRTEKRRPSTIEL